ncbi:MAG: flagellar biosynthetic protein FliO, partial [Plesiomonas shigelloides]
VNVEGQRLLLGVTPQSISLLKELGDAPENHANPPSGFQQQLNALLEKRKSAAKSAASASDNESAH